MKKHTSSSSTTSRATFREKIDSTMSFDCTETSSRKGSMAPVREDPAYVPENDPNHPDFDPDYAMFMEEDEEEIPDAPKPAPLCMLLKKRHSKMSGFETIMADCWDLMRSKIGDKVIPMAQLALESLDVDLLSSVVEQADVVEYRDASGHVEECARIMRLPEKELVELQLENAVAQGNEERKASCTLRLKEIKFAPLAQKALERLETDLLSSVVEQANHEAFHPSYIEDCARMLRLPEHELFNCS